MTEISGKLLPGASRITLTDAKYLLLNIQFSEMIMDIYDFNENGSVEREELESVYCLFKALVSPTDEKNPSDKPENRKWWERWKEWKLSVSDSKNVFNYILRYQEIPSSLEPPVHFVWADFTEELADEKVILSRPEVIKLTTVLFLRFFPEKYFPDASFKSEVLIKNSL